MAKIKVLDKKVAELIAAGEVVERPASVVKELIENSIDAGASKITVEIKGGGIGYMRITDNGHGIDKEDIRNAFKRHATSKVAVPEDLEAIGTLGFRGEALASIAAVAKVELITKTKDSLHGWSYKIEGGEEVSAPAETGTPDGTTIIIRDIFYNTPARMKFLRSDISEGNAVSGAVDKAALSRPEVAFEFIRDTKNRLQTSGNNDLRAVIAKIYGRDFAEDTLKVDFSFENNKVRVYGYVGAPNNSKPTRTYQNFFISGRYVRSATCSAALGEAFKGKLMTGRLPIAVLFIDIDNSKVDVNVHPAKIEVRFSEEKEIYNAVYFAVKNALMKTENPINETMPVKPNVNINIEVEETIKPNLPPERIAPVFIKEEPLPSSSIELASPSREKKVHGSSVFETAFSKLKETEIEQQRLECLVEEKDTTKANAENTKTETLKFVGELFDTYIILQNQQDEMLLVDKHAAHERLIYEEIKKNIWSENRQVLLSAKTITLQLDEYSMLLANEEALRSLGFLVEDFGMGTIVVREVPVMLKGEDIAFIISEIAANLNKGKQDLTPEVLNRLFYSIACKAAVRAGDKNNKYELMEIIKRLESNPEITHCPHGRPVSVRMPRKEIEKMFGRLG